MGIQGYGQFCPVAMAAEILGSRWTIVLLRELIAGSTRFNDLRKGVSRMSPTLLSKRLRELEAAGIIERASPRSAAYRLTEAGQDLKLVIDAFGIWGQRWMSKQMSLQNVDPFLLMLDMKRNVDPGRMPKDQAVIHVRYPELSPGLRQWWLIVEGDDVDITQDNPEVDPDLTVESSLAVMTEIWMGLATVGEAIEANTLRLRGDQAVADSMQAWLGLSPFASVPKRAA